METRIDKFNESKSMSRVAKNSSLYREINDSELDNFNVRSNATVIGNQDKEIDVEQIKKILDKRYNSAPRRRSIRIEPQEEVSRISVDDTKEYDLTKVLEKAKDEKVETYEENRAKKLRNTQYDILNNLNLDASEEEVKEEKKETVESEMNAEVKKTAQTFRSVYMKEKSELNTLKVKRKIINCLEEKGYAAVDCDNQIDMVNREKVEEFCKAAEKEEQATVDIVQPNRDSLQY